MKRTRRVQSIAGDNAVSGLHKPGVPVTKVSRIRNPTEFDYVVLAYLYDNPDPVAVGDIALGVGVPVNRVRLSLGILRFAGLADLDRVRGENLWTAR